MTELYSITKKITSTGKGILAADESTGTMTKRLDSINVPSTPENRLLFRETLLSSQSMNIELIALPAQFAGMIKNLSV